MRMNRKELEKLIQAALEKRPDSLFTEIYFQLGAVPDKIRREDVQAALHDMLVHGVVSNSNGKWRIARDYNKKLTA